MRAGESAAASEPNGSRSGPASPTALASHFNVTSIACIVATIAFWAYSQTLLPGVDLGDTGGFQAAVLWPEVSARQGYPLYYAVARPFVAALSPANPARGLNLFSAVWAAGAVALLVFITATVARSLAAGVVAGFFLAFSYTFWTQAVIAEVYSLHLTLIGVCLVALHAFSIQPSRARIAIFFALYALSFGNHLSMILMLVPFAVFLLQASRSPRDLFRPAVVGIAITMAVMGALQYVPDFIATWTSIDASQHWTDRVASFWFDATKADWREESVFGVTGNAWPDRLAMWMWDIRQQFGLAGIVLAIVGAVRLWWISPPWANLLWLAFIMSTLFALDYNVGDTHVFLLPGHLWTAFAAGCALAPMPKGTAPGRIMRLAVICAAIAYCGFRGWATWPAADRHLDRRGEQLVARTTYGVSDQHTLLVTEMDWQSENALLYAARFERQDLTWVRLADVLPHFPFLVRDNREIGRDLLLTSAAAATVVSAYGPAFSLVPDDTLPVPSIVETVEAIPRGSPYVLTLLTPTGDQQLNPEEVLAVFEELTGQHELSRNTAGYGALAGVKGEAPTLFRSSYRPFTERFTIGDDSFTVRMDSWLPSDTFRRGGFGHVLRDRQHALLIERGLSLVWFDDHESSSFVYAAGLYAPQPRFRIPSQTGRLARQ